MIDYEKIKDIIDKKAATDPKLRSIIKRIENGSATFRDTAEYSGIISDIFGRSLSANVLNISERETVCSRLLKDRYEDINGVLARVQQSLDEKTGLHLAPKKAAFPAERVAQIAHSLVDPSVPDETITRRASSAANVSMSFHDDYIRENAKFRNDAGLKCYINRSTNGKCCAWCSAIAGRYVYGNEPHDVYRRHDNCSCSVTYENGRQRQDVWSKRSWDAHDIVEGAPPPARFTPEQAKALEQQNLQYRGLTNSTSNDIIESGIPYLDAMPRLERHSIEDCYNTTNPNYGNSIEYERNCQRCIAAYEARRRGFDVIARPAAIDDEPLKNSYGSHGWTNIFENGEKNLLKVDGTSASEIKKNICLQMESYGDGSRAAIKVSFGRNKGHVFIAEQVNGKTVFIDPQIGDNNCSYWLMEGMVIPENTRLLRIDDKKFSNLIAECVE